MSNGVVRTPAAVVGIGATEQGELPGESSDEIAARAARLAIADAGLLKSDIDGLITCKPTGIAGRPGIDEAMGPILGINPAFSSTLEYGACGFSLHLAAMAIESGLATTVLLTYGTNQRTAKRSFATAVGGSAQWASYIGFLHVAGPAAMAVRRHMHRYGTTEEQLGWISVAQREWAQNNPIAVFRDPMTIDDYLAQPYVVAPLRRSDLTMISDGGAAFVLTTAERANDLRAKPVYQIGMSQHSGMRGDQNPEKLMRPWLGEIARKLWQSTGLGPGDMDAVYLQDATSVWILQQLEYYGFCGIGEGGPFVAAGNTRPGGSLPVNTHGGQLSESYMWNWMHLYELVRQLRGDAGPRQIAGAEVALLAQTHDFWKGAASVFSTAAHT